MPVKAKYTLNCEAFGVIPPPSAPVVSDNCPHPAMVGKCLHMENPEDRLCSKCSLQLTHSSTPDLQACLWGSNLLPRLDRNLLWTHFAPPIPALPITYVVGGVQTGCKATDYTGVAGKVVMLMFPTKCLPMEAAMAAQGVGVKGLIFLTGAQGTVTQTIEGSSQFIFLPVHSVEPRHFGQLDALFRQRGVPVAGTAAGVVAFDLVVSAAEGVAEARVPMITPTPSVVVGEVIERMAEDGLQFTVGVVVAFCFAVGLLVACVWVMYMQKRDAVKLPAERKKSTKLQIPLSAASMGLSLSLLLLVAVVAFSLAFVAGEDAKNTAVVDGEDASTENYISAVQNVKLISDQLRLNVLGQVRAGLDQLLDEGEHTASSVGALYFDSVITWDSLYAKYNLMVKMAMRAPTWRPAAIFKGGFHFAFKTRSFIAPGSDPAVRDIGTAHGVMTLLFDPARGVNFALGGLPPSVNRLMYHNRLGTEFGDPMKLTGNLPDGTYRWHLSRKTALQEPDVTSMYKQPLSVYTPIYNQQKEYLGCVQSDLQLSSIASMVTKAINSASLENATTVVFEADTNTVVSTNAHPEGFPYMSFFLAANVRAYELYKMHQIPTIHLVALAQAIQGRDTRSFSDTIDQRRHFRAPDHKNELMNLVVSGGRVDDTSQLQFHSEMRGECVARGDCFGSDAGDEVMRFYGDNMLNIYKNLTLDTTDVAITRSSPLGAPWQSTLTQYNFSMALPGTAGILDTERCVYMPRIMPGLPEQCHVKRPFVEESYTLHIRFRADADVSPTDRNQILFASSWGNSALLRVFASGFVMVEVASFGCRTAIPTEATKGGVWHTLTAITDRVGRTCEVHVDGVHMSTGRLSDPEGKGLYTAIGTTDPHIVGRNFVGAISSLRIWEMPLVAEELAQLVRTGDMTRHVPSKEWLVDVQQFSRNSSKSSVLDWRLGVMIPQDDVMRGINANNAVTRRRLAVRTENLDRKLKQKSYETILIVIALVLALCLSSLCSTTP